jgi:hypothetical protein
MSSVSTTCIIPIKLEISKEYFGAYIIGLLKLLPNKYQATLEAILINNPAKTNQEALLNKELRSIKDLEWNYAVVIKTTKKYEAFVVYFMRKIYNQIQSTPFHIDNAIATLNEVLTEKDTFSISPLTKFNLTPTTSVYYLPKKKRLSSLPDDCLQEIATHLTLNDYHSLTQACKSIKRTTADIITTNLLKGELKEDLLHQIFSHDNLTLLKKFIHILKDIELAPLLNKYWNALDCWTYLFKKEMMDKTLIYQHYPLGKALLACIVGYGYNTQTELYIEGYNLYYEPEIPLQSSINPTEFHFYELENKLRQFIQTADLKINKFPYNYNMIDNFSKTVYCKGLPNKEFTIGLSFYDIVTKARYYFVNRVQTYLSNKMLAFLFKKGLTYLPNPICTSSKKLQLRIPRRGSRSSYPEYDSEELTNILAHYYTNEEHPQLQIKVDSITHEITRNTGSYNIFSDIDDDFRILPKENSILQDIMSLINLTNRKIEEL